MLIYKVLHYTYQMSAEFSFSSDSYMGIGHAISSTSASLSRCEHSIWTSGCRKWRKAGVRNMTRSSMTFASH